MMGDTRHLYRQGQVIATGTTPYIFTAYPENSGATGLFPGEPVLLKARQTDGNGNVLKERLFNQQIYDNYSIDTFLIFTYNQPVNNYESATPTDPFDRLIYTTTLDQKYEIVAAGKPCDIVVKVDPAIISDTAYGIINKQYYWDRTNRYVTTTNTKNGVRGYVHACGRGWVINTTTKQWEIGNIGLLRITTLENNSAIKFSATTDDTVELEVALSTKGKKNKDKKGAK